MDASKKGFEGNLVQLQITINKKAASFTAFFERIIQIILI
jgi:hypothetical protein